MKHEKLIDAYLPKFHFGEYHEILVNRSMHRTYEAAMDFDMSKSKLIKGLFRLRGLPTKRMNLQGFISDVGFTPLAENRPKEILIGFWMTDRIVPISGYDDFVANRISAKVKVVWNFYLEEMAPHQVRLSTETRVLGTTPAARLLFGLYWLAIRLFSGLVRRQMLRIIKQESEAPGKVS